MLNTYKFIIAALTSLLLVTGGAGAQEITLQKLNVNGAFSAEMAPFVHDSNFVFCIQPKKQRVSKCLESGRPAPLQTF